MRIICSVCKTIIGEQKPFSDYSEVNAKCVSCLRKEREARKARPISELGKEREVVFDNGRKGILSIAGKETDELSFWDLIVAGNKFSCSEEGRDEFQRYLDKIREEEVDVTFLHSITVKLDKPLDGRRKRKEIPPVEEKKSDSIHYNCTIRVPKHYVFSIFNDKIDRMEKVAEILANGAYRLYQEECQKTAQKGNLSPMSGPREADSNIS